MVKAARLAGLVAVAFFADVVRDTEVATLRPHPLILPRRETFAPFPHPEEARNAVSKDEEMVAHPAQHEGSTVGDAVKLKDRLGTGCLHTILI